MSTYHPTYDAIMRDCIAQALSLPRDPISESWRDVTLAAMNEHAEIIWLSWPFDNEKIDEFDAPAADADGVITFASDVETVFAVRALSATGDGTTGQRIWNENDVLAATKGVRVSTDRFVTLAADSSHCRRIQVNPAEDASTVTHRVLALKKYALAEVSGSYDAGNPSATPDDYRVKTFVLDLAVSALRAGVKDSLRAMQGIPRERNFDKLLALAIHREEAHGDQEHRTDPKSPMFDEVGEWY